MRILKIFTLLLLVISSCAHAKVILPSIISDNMVLQQQTKVKLWGISGKKTDIEVSTSWNDRVYKTKSDSEGKWELVVETGKVGGPYKIVINDGNIVELNEILLGEVWLCSGQSNMEMPMKGFWGQPIEHSSEVIANATKILYIVFAAGKYRVKVDMLQPNAPKTDVLIKSSPLMTCSAIHSTIPSSIPTASHPFRHGDDYPFHFPPVKKGVI